MKFRVLLGLLALAAPAVRADDVLPKLWFPVGEEITYDIHWGFIYIGSTHVTTSWTNHNGQTVLAIRYATRTNKFMDKIYRVDDLLETLIEPRTFLPISFTKDTHEGRTRHLEITEFDHAKREAVYRNVLKNKTKTFAIDADTRDLIAMMYWLRREPFSVNSNYTYRVMADEKLYDLGLKVAAEEQVEVGDEEVEVPCLRIDPVAAFNGLFIRKGKVTFWVTKDERRVCTRMVGEVPVASVQLTLNSLRTPGLEPWPPAPE